MWGNNSSKTSQRSQHPSDRRYITNAGRYLRSYSLSRRVVIHCLFSHLFIHSFVSVWDVTTHVHACTAAHHQAKRQRLTWLFGWDSVIICRQICHSIPSAGQPLRHLICLHDNVLFGRTYCSISINNSEPPTLPDQKTRSRKTCARR